MKRGNFSRADLISCNRCRLAIGVVTLADIVTGDGKRIHDNYIGAHPNLVNTGKIYRERRQTGVKPATLAMDLPLAHRDHSTTYVEIPVYTHCVCLNTPHTGDGDAPPIRAYAQGYGPPRTTVGIWPLSL
jgi:hypothetical protein